jgi:hypothetical protein
MLRAVDALEDGQRPPIETLGSLCQPVRISLKKTAKILGARELSVVPNELSFLSPLSHHAKSSVSPHACMS